MGGGWLDRLVREGLSEEVILEHKFDEIRGKPLNSKGIQGGRKNKYKVAESRNQLSYVQRNWKKTVEYLRVSNKKSGRR